jgi:PD-(D/E)XK nuclease superfamily
MSALHAVVLTPAARTTPTLWSHMRLCNLRAALSTNREADEWVLHSPRAWLGTAFHQLMADAPNEASQAAAIWDAAIANVRTVASRHRLDSRFTNPERWPGFYLVRQRAITSAVEHGRRNTTTAYRRKPSRSPTPGGGSNHILTARGGRLAGRPDQYDRFTVTEFKSALPDPAWAESASIIDGYWRQLRLYSVLIGERGNWPTTARIVAASGQTLEEPVNRIICELEADSAVSALDAMNQVLEGGANSSVLANPGKIACGQCPFLAICPAFWSWCEANSWPEVREPAARGSIESVDPGMDGDLYAVKVNLRGRHGSGGPLSIALRRSVHGDLTGCPTGTLLRIVFANTRPDGRLRADISTCVFREDEIPELRIASRS